MNFRQLSRLSPLIRVASRQIASPKILKNTSVKLIPIRCLGGALGANDEEYLKIKKAHEEANWSEFTSTSIKLTAYLVVGCIFVAFLCFRESIYVLMEFDTVRLAVDDDEVDMRVKQLADPVNKPVTEPVTKSE